jgi:hypothetical protein
MKYNYKILLFFIPILGIVLTSYLQSCQVQSKPARAFQTRCGSCHALPNLADLPKHIWKKTVLPEMAARLGIKQDGYNSMHGAGYDEQYAILKSGVYPSTPQMSEQEWKEIYDYILAQAPDTIHVDLKRAKRSKPLKQFSAQFIEMDEQKGGATMAMKYNANTQKLLIGDYFGNVYAWQYHQKPTIQQYLFSPISSLTQLPNKLFALEMGGMYPSEMPLGKLWEINSGKRKTLIDKLHRPVDIKVADLNGDKLDDIVIAEFGYHTGKLSILKAQKGGKYEKKDIFKIPGILRVLVKDMNRDNQPDLILFATQAKEGMYILYNRGNFNFAIEQPIELPPHYGTSWGEMVDYDQDGDLDVVIANGDNADYSITLKNYHGIRLYSNNGKNEFEEAFFYPIHGATRVIAQDFDGDKDIDFAVTAFYPDFENNPKESFVYLENTHASQYQWKPYTLEQASQSRWIVMEAGDYDQDGDMDLMLGAFTTHLAATTQAKKWQSENVDLLFLENQKFIRKGGKNGSK